MKVPRFTRLTKDGHEKLDPKPVAVPVGFTRQPSMADLIREGIRNETFRQRRIAAGQETFEEADDFDIPDDPPDPQSPWERDFDPAGDAEVLAEARAILERKRRPQPPADAENPDKRVPPASAKE